MLRYAIDERRSLRLLEESDAEELYAVIAANRERLARWLPWAPQQTLERTLEFIRSTRRQIGDNDGLQTVIVVDGAIAGMIGMHRIDWPNRTTSLGYWLAAACSGQGTVTEACRAYTDQAVGRWGLNRVEIRVASDNARSRAIPERLGFAEEGILRDAERIGERWVDHVVYATVARDWPDRRR